MLTDKNKNIKLYKKDRKAFEKQINALEEKYNGLRKKVFSGNDIGNKLNIVMAMEKRTGISVMSFSPEKTIDFNEYRKDIINIKIRGSFNRVLKFIYEMENSEYIMNIESIEITKSDKTKSKIHAEIKVGTISI